MTKLEQIQAAEARLLIHTYDRFPVLFVAGEDVHLIDENGDRYLDLLSGIGVNALGYSNKVIQDTIAEQSRTLINASNYYFNDKMAGLAERVTRITGMDRAYFGNSGCEAVEAALKLARAHAGVLREEGKQIGTKFLALEQSFHGRTFGAISATYKEKYRAPFEPVVPGFEFVKFNDVDDLRAKFSNEVCGILLEAIQGEGGVRPLSQEFFAEARKLADSTGALLIVDEIQAGLGRTGKWCAYQHFGIMPDITTLAKPLAGGIPMSATLCTNEVARAFHAGMHGTTFGGGPFACAVASAVIDYIEENDLLAHVVKIGDYFQAELTKLAERHSYIVDVRGKGLMIAAELNSADLAKHTVTEMLKNHVVINQTSDTVLRFLPPFVFERVHVDTTIAALDKIFTAYTAAQAAVPSSVGGQTHG
ncbi:MAG: aspartate aminotransferase family protein [Terracidiphilus sp.]|jgi:acetylornithine aminotransferase/acetylornithine/N-succinyldiaminopimelate aminotransferase